MAMLNNQRVNPLNSIFSDEKNSESLGTWKSGGKTGGKTGRRAACAAWTTGFTHISLQCGAPKISKLPKSGWILWFIVDITTVNGVYKPTYNWGAPLCGNCPNVKKKTSMDSTCVYIYMYMYIYIYIYIVLKKMEKEQGFQEQC